MPEPTSPWSRRCIGVVRPRSASISAIALVLRRREREGEHVAIRGDELRRGRQRLGDEHLPLRGTSSEGELEREQLVEREAPAGLLGLGVRARAMEPDERVGAQW